VLELHDGPQLPVEVENEAVLEVIGGGHEDPFVRGWALRSLARRRG
jgi:hypothetical protein